MACSRLRDQGTAATCTSAGLHKLRTCRIQDSVDCCNVCLEHAEACRDTPTEYQVSLREEMTRIFRTPAMIAHHGFGMLTNAYAYGTHAAVRVHVMCRSHSVCS